MGRCLDYAGEIAHPANRPPRLRGEGYRAAMPGFEAPCSLSASTIGCSAPVWPPASTTTRLQLHSAKPSMLSTPASPVYWPMADSLLKLDTFAKDSMTEALLAGRIARDKDLEHGFAKSLLTNDDVAHFLPSDDVPRVVARRSRAATPRPGTASCRSALGQVCRHSSVGFARGEPPRQ
jgi:hypothetical protein